jgi:replication factor C subunit 2/4
MRKFKIKEVSSSITLDKIVFDSEGLESLVYIANGDMRNAVNNLQAIYISTGSITKQNVFTVCDVPSREKTEGLIRKLLNGDLDKGLKDFESLWNENYCLHDLAIYLGRTCERIEGIQLDLRMELIMLASHLKLNEAEGIISKTQFLAFLAKVCQLGIAYYK